ncbi:MAG: hypothetical protein IPF79_02330 [Ignavibacteria bacterium]|nr:hypothetical protein [Ignavibacteria bacterium]
MPWLHNEGDVVVALRRIFIIKTGQTNAYSRSLLYDLVGSTLTSLRQLSTEEIAIVQNLFGMEKRRSSPRRSDDAFGFRWVLAILYEVRIGSQGYWQAAHHADPVVRIEVPGSLNETQQTLMDDALGDGCRPARPLTESYYTTRSRRPLPNGRCTVASDPGPISTYPVKLAIREAPVISDIKLKAPKK